MVTFVEELVKLKACALPRDRMAVDMKETKVQRLLIEARCMMDDAR